MSGARRRASVVVAVVATTVLGSCGSDSLPTSPPVVNVTMREYRFDLDGSVQPGRTVFRATNAGRLRHEMALVVLPADYPENTLDQLRSKKRRALATRAYLPRRPPGASGTFAVDLAKGRYALMCFVTGSGGEAHALKGMTLQFKVS